MRPTLEHPRIRLSKDNRGEIAYRSSINSKFHKSRRFVHWV